MIFNLKIRKCVFAAFIIAGMGYGAFCDEDKNEAKSVRHSKNGEVILTLNVDAQKRIGLTQTNPVESTWQPEYQATGEVLDVAPLMDLLADYKRAQIALTASNKQMERANILRKDSNISEKSYEELLTQHQQCEVNASAILNKIRLTWGNRIQELAVSKHQGTNEESKNDFLMGIPQSNVLVRVELPFGERIQNQEPVRLSAWTTKKTDFHGDFFDVLPFLNSSTQRQSVLFTVHQTNDNHLISGEAVRAWVRKQEGRQSGALVPAEAVLRLENKGWCWIRLSSSEFLRREVSLDFPVNGKYFCRGLSQTNPVVVAGAQTLLSAELDATDSNSGQNN